MARILLTGAAGFVGSNLAEHLLARGDSVTGIDNFNSFYDPALKRRNVDGILDHPRFELIEGDICDRACVDRAFDAAKPDAVIHLAAWAGVRPSLEKPAVYVRNNVEGTTVLLERARAHPGLRFVQASSSSVYGAVNAVPFREDMDVDRPISVYAATKRACEIMAQTYHTLYGMDIWSIRLFTCYGPRQRPDLAINKFATLLAADKPIPVFGDGSTCRDYLWVDDAVAAFAAAADRCAGCEVINVGESRTVRLDELILHLAREMGVEPRIERLPPQAGDVPRTFADVSKARRLLGYEPRTMIEDGIRRFVAWHRAQR